MAAPRKPAPAFTKETPLTKAPNAGAHPIDSQATKPSPTPTPSTSVAEGEIPMPLAQFSVKMDAALLHRFRRTAAIQGIKVQDATSQAITLWLQQKEN